ncbi:GntR family transcriptional regulator [Prosthecomicrobium sp. N25]|uniref:GntR family transcriptional regulator n=1 Tax=Prosthecomicrobium sp. N25 TaxID=3129254 RepID=UPI0030780EF0
MGAEAPQLWRANRPKGSSETVYADLKARILTLDIVPGGSLSEPELSLAYGVSRTPVREALIRLADEGLVDIVPKSGTSVARIPLGLLPEAIVVRKALEEATVRAAAERATGSAVLQLEAAQARLTEVAEQGDFEAFHLADEAFHATIAAVAGYPGIWTLVERAKMHIDRYRRLTLPQEGRLRKVIVEHAAVLDGIRRRDPDAASAAMRDHLAGLEISIDQVRDANPDFFQ